MADLKISQLTGATTPLAGTEVLPIVQSGATKKVTADDLTVKNIRSNATTGVLQVTGPAAASTRVMTVPDANFTSARTDAAQSFTGDQTLATGNLVIGTAGKGIDFSADPSAAGMTSELLDDYEEGTWTPSVGGTPTYVRQFGTYTKVGRVVTVNFTVQLDAATGASATTITGLPFTAASSSTLRQSGSVAYFDALATAVTSIVPVVDSGQTSITFAGTTAAQTLISQINVFSTFTYVQASLTYITE